MKSPIAGTGTQQANASTSASAAEAVKKSINSELWQACAGPLVNLPAAGTHVVYFPQGHSEQVAASMKKDANAQIPNYPNLPSKLLCLLHNVTLHADPETDEVYAQMTLQPVSSFDKDGLVRSDLSMKVHKPPPEFFCKTLTASDTSTHGGFSVPRRAAERIFPPLDFTMQPPAQELVARDLHDNVWNFRHIYRGQPKRHLLTSGWSLFVSGKKLFAGDSVLFIRDERQQLLLGVRRANRQPANLSSSVLSSDSMHIGILAAAAHATANNSPFSVFYNPRASPSEFVIPLAKYYKAACSNQISLGMRFRMMFETEESGTRRCMGTITGISDLDPVRWKNSQWRNLQVGWDEATAGEKRNRVSIWDIEPITAPFFIFPTAPLFHSKRPRQPEMPDNDLSDLDNIFRRTMPWIGDDYGLNDPQAQPGLSVVQWMNTQQNPPLANSMQPNFMGSDISRQLSLSAAQTPPQPNMQFNSQRPCQPPQQWDQLPKLQSSLTNHLGSVVPTSHGPAQIVPSPSSSAIPAHDHVFQQPQSLISHHQLQNPMTFNSNQLRFHDNQKPEFLEIPPTLIPSQGTAASAVSVMIPPSQVLSQPAARNNGHNNIQFAQQTGHVVPASPNPIGNRQFSAAAAGGVSSAVTDDVPSCSTSPSTNYCPNNVLSTMNSRNQHAAVSLSNPCGLESVPSNGGLMNDLQRKAVGVRPTMNVGHNLGAGIVGLEAHLTANGAHLDYLDSSSSATSVLSQNEVQMPPTHNNSVSLNSQSMFFREMGLDIEVQGETRNNGQPEMPMNVAGTFKEVQTSNMLLSGGDMFSCYKNQDVEAELSTSVVSQSFGVPNMPINSIDSSMNDRGLVSWGTWDPPHPLPPMRTYTKVYKRGAVGRSIDITHYSGYDELKQDLARRFGIEGQLEDRQRVGWKLVYVDHENDVLLVGDDPWEEFVNCVRCIKILSPQEVEHMSLDGDVGNNAATANQACSSSMS